MPVTLVHRADTSAEPIVRNSERSAFRHVFVYRKMSACVCVGVRQMLEYKTIGVAYGRYLRSHLCCRPVLLPSDTAALRLRPLLSSLRHCCQTPTTAAVYIVLPLPPCALCCRCPSLTTTHFCFCVRTSAAAHTPPSNTPGM